LTLLSEINFPVLFGKWHTTVGGMKRCAFRSTNLSNRYTVY